MPDVDFRITYEPGIVRIEADTPLGYWTWTETTNGMSPEVVAELAKANALLWIEAGTQLLKEREG